MSYIDNQLTISNLKDENSQLRQKMTRAQNTNRNLRKENRELKNRIEELQEELADLVQYAMNTQNQEETETTSSTETETGTRWYYGSSTSYTDSDVVEYVNNSNY